ncbi:MAG: hypothetical protein QOJ15_6656 [Bradyrhizobium sp.]|nr:hypothetical protein [Bradyrhizobium sp.]
MSADVMPSEGFGQFHRVATATLSPAKPSGPFPTVLARNFYPVCTVDAWGQVCLAVIDPGIRKTISDAGEPGLVLGH